MACKDWVIFLVLNSNFSFPFLCRKDYNNQNTYFLVLRIINTFFWFDDSGKNLLPTKSNPSQDEWMQHKNQLKNFGGQTSVPKSNRNVWEKSVNFFTFPRNFVFFFDLLLIKTTCYFKRNMFWQALVRKKVN